MTTVDLEPLVWARTLPPEMRRHVRERAGLSRKELADAIAVSTVTIWRYEAGRQRPSGDAGRAYCRVLFELAKGRIG
jgi:DNA-binding XRE family transcriptional regulator